MKHGLLKTTALAALIAMAANTAWAEELTVLIDNNPDTSAMMNALTAAYTKLHPDITFSIEVRPGGAQGDNIIKTRLATQDMDDIFNYNTGSLFQAMHPTRTLEPLDDLSNMGNIQKSFKSVVTGSDGKVYSVPYGAAMGGGILYNRKIYSQLGLSVPKTWADFMENSEKIKQAGIAPIAATYGDTWTSQLFVLGDYFNVQAQVPDFAAEYTANKAKYATTPAAIRGFEHLQEAYEAGFYNKDFGAANYNDGLKMLVDGKAAQYPMLTFAIAAIKQNFPDKLNDIGFFAQPGDAADSNGLTVWMPGGLYIPKSSSHKKAAKDFLNWAATVDACEIEIKAAGASGPYMIKGCELPSDVPPAVSDMMPYFKDEARNAPALEFLSPVKGPNLEQITVQVGSGISSASEGAALYDQDVKKQAQQLGLQGW